MSLDSGTSPVDAPSPYPDDVALEALERLRELGVELGRAHHPHSGVERLQGLHELGLLLEVAVGDAVDEARSRFVPWSSIGVALGGVSKQAVFNRYGR